MFFFIIQLFRQNESYATEKFEKNASNSWICSPDKKIRPETKFRLKNRF